MRYYIDNEFLEGRQDKTIFGIKYGETKPTIDLISVGIVSEDNREYYAISKDFNLKEAWDRFQMKQVYGDDRNTYQEGIKEYWLRENVLKPIFIELHNIFVKDKDYKGSVNMKFNYHNFKYLLSKYGKTNKQIAEDIKEFIYYNIGYSEYDVPLKEFNFIGYYADYDWVVFCWLFGKMIDLPKGFNMYATDLKQMLDEKIKNMQNNWVNGWGRMDLETKIKQVQKSNLYPKEVCTHHALSDAKFNKQLHEFLNTL